MKIHETKNETGPMAFHKYRAVRTVVDGITFPSKFEAAVYSILKILENSGAIKILELQPIIRLTKAKIMFKPDFKVQNLKTKEIYYVEPKGMETATFKIKKKLWAHYGPAKLEIWKGTHVRPYLDETVDIIDS